MHTLYTDISVWAHGYEFKVRRVRFYRLYDTRFWRLRRAYSHGISDYVIFDSSGRFLCRVSKKQIKRWTQYYGLERLKNEVRCLESRAR